MVVVAVVVAARVHVRKTMGVLGSCRSGSDWAASTTVATFVCLPTDLVVKMGNNGR